MIVRPRKKIIPAAYTKAILDDNQSFTSPHVRTDMIDAVGMDLDLEINNLTVSELENDFGKYLHIIKKLEDDNDVENKHEVLAKHNLIISKLEARLVNIYTPEYVALIKQTFHYEQSKDANPALVAAAVAVARAFKHDKTEDGKSALIAATNVLVDNSAENRNEVLTLIDKNRKGKFKKAGFVSGVLASFLGAAMIAAGIACVASGVGFIPGIMLLNFGAVYVLPAGLIATKFFSRRSYGDHENALVKFGDSMIDDAKKIDANASIAKIGIFSTTKENVVQSDDESLKLLSAATPSI